MSRDPTFYLEDIRDSAAKIRRYTAELEFDEFAQRDMAFDAVVRNLEIIGEAAKRVPPHLQAKTPHVEWRKIAGLRDVIAHGYFGLNPHVLWDVVKNRLPDLERAVDRYLSNSNQTG